MVIRRVVMLAFLILTLPARAEIEGDAPESAVLVSHVSGRVSVRRVGDQVPSPAKRGMVLHPGDRITAEGDGDATVLVGTTPMHLGARPGRTWIAGQPLEAPRPGIGERFRNLFGGAGATSRPGGSEFRGLPDGVRARPLRGMVAGDVAFEWVPVPGVTRYRISLREQFAAQPGPLRSAEVVGTTWSVPAAQLAAGKTYVWTLEAVGGRGLPLRNSFTVATAKARESAAAGASDPMARAARLVRAGFADEALDVYLAAPPSEAAKSAVADLLRKSSARE